MKINEVFESNKTIIVLRDIDTNFNKLYPRIVKLAKSLNKLKSKLDPATLTNMTGYLDSFIDDFITQANRILNTNFNKNDQQIKKLIRKIKRMLHNIDYLRKNL